MNKDTYHRDKDYLKYESLFENIFRKRFSIIKKYINNGKMLEVGSSTGVMLKIFKDGGFNVTGIEPSGSCKDAQKKGLNVLNTTFEKADIKKNYFDLVVLNHTLEHMDNPNFTLNKINSILKENGIVFIDVPNFGSLSSRILGKKWPYLLPLEHKSQFTKKSLAELLKNNGFELLHWESRSGLFEYAKPLKELKRKRFLIDILLLPYSLLATLLNMGDSMSFVARKIR